MNDWKEGREVSCRQCGEGYIAYHPSAKFCPDCRAARKKGQDCSRVREQRRKKGARPALSLSEACRAARAAGLTYGQWVMKYGN